MTPEMLAPAPETASVPAPEDHPELDGIETEDHEPLDSPYQEKLHRILTESLFASWPGPGEGRTFRVFSNVGLFSDPQKPPLVPDVMLALDVPHNLDLHLKPNRSYFTWIVGKPPDVVIEFVSDTRGEEGTTKLNTYAAIGVPFCAIFDPKHKVSKDTLKIHRLVGKAYQPVSGNQFDGIGLGLVLWPGRYEDADENWLRWCDPKGVVIPTGKERADKLAHRTERLAERLRELGIDPDAINGT